MGEREEHVRRWLERARHDLRTAQTMLDVPDPPVDVACLHAQQRVEKCLKACLCAADVDAPRTHDLVHLLDLCVDRDARLEGLRESARALADYAVTTRYPDEWREIPVEEGRDAAAKAREAMELVRSLVLPAGE
ncbi:MAG: HEPN domain-containing protein [Planctomycetota bacterium]|jgi:HEPN domain-containing protein